MIQVGTTRGQNNSSTTGGLTNAELRATPVDENLATIKGVAVDTGAGNVAAGTQRVVLATDQPAIATTQNASTTGTGGTTPFTKVSTANNNATVVKNAPGKLHSITAINITAAIVYLKFYNKATLPAPTTDVPVSVFPIPANTDGAGFTVTLPYGVNFSAGIGYAIVAGIAVNDNTSIAADAVVITGTFS